MKITLTTKELLEIVNEKFQSEVEITQVNIELPIRKYIHGIIFIEKNDWFVSSEVEEKIKEKGE